MKRLLFLLAALVVAPAASAQWTYDGTFPADGSAPTPHNHGLAVDPEGKVWVQAYYPFTGDSVAVDPAVAAASTPGCNATTNNCRVVALYVFNPDGTQADFSPLSIVELPGGEADTLGGGTIINSTGVKVWDYSSGRGVTAGPDGDIFAAFFNTLYKFDYETGAVLDKLEPTIFDTRGLAGPSVDAAGNVYLTGVFNGDPFAIFDPNLDYLETIVAADGGFNRAVLAIPEADGVSASLTAIALNYSEDVATVYQRADEFAEWDSTGVAFEGMSAESAAIHPVTGNIWVSAGSPNDPPSSPWQQHTWYEFTVEDALANAQPTPLDSIVWEGGADGRPRAIAFSPDGQTAYVGEFNLASPAVQKFVFAGTAAVEGPSVEGVTLHQNAPNPFTASTTIRYELDAPATVRLTVYDALGRAVATLADGTQSAGTHTETFRANGLAGGVYSYVLQVDGSALTGRMVLMR